VSPASGKPAHRKGKKSAFLHLNLLGEYVQLNAIRFMGSDFAETHRIMPKEPPLDQLRSVFRLIRERADYALNLLKESDEVRALCWRCLVCGNAKKFTRPVPRDVAIPCPKCKSTDFVPER
jgi:hypothetical protein